MASSGSLPPGWVSKESKSHPGRVYFYNTVTKESVWEVPTEPAAGRADGSNGGAPKAPPTEIRASHILVRARLPVVGGKREGAVDAATSGRLHCGERRMTFIVARTCGFR